MGVTGLWQILQPCARPIKIETLNRKRLAIDASIWIYQFLKAVRDKEGNALRNSHVVGFFRRICKLLFYGIKPVFVFDGGAPALKRQTISGRKARREGRREDAVRTAGKLLAVQMQRLAEEEDAKSRAGADHNVPVDEEPIPEGGLVYAEEAFMSQKERAQNRKFRKKDAYHLPELDVSMNEMGGPNDPRVMSLEDLQEYARQFEAGEDINIYDFSKIDYDSPFFMSLPASDRYNILNAARLRSRLRMGHSKEQLDTMFPDRMAFSKFQIERVRERNDLTQRLMHLNGFDGADYGQSGGPGRVAGEKGREYVLVKNDGVEGGWALGVIGDEGKQEKPIDVDKPTEVDNGEEQDWEDDEDFEDIPIEGLNRLPKPRAKHEDLNAQLNRQRMAVYKSRAQGTKRAPGRSTKTKPQSDSLFVQESDEEEEGGGDDWKNVGDPSGDLFGEDTGANEEDEQLRAAIAMSLQKDDAKEANNEAALDPLDAKSDDDDDMLEVFNQKAVEEQKPLPRGSGRAIASIVNKRAFNAAPESREITSFGVPSQKPDESDDEDSFDLQAALAESRRNKRKISPPRPRQRVEASAPAIAKKAGFSGPLPFEKLDLGTSLLGKKKMQQRTEETAGGFENLELQQKKQKQAEPLPPWFSGDIANDLKKQKAIEVEDRERAREFDQQFRFQDRGELSLRRARPEEPIDLEAEEPPRPNKQVFVDLDEDETVASPIKSTREANDSSNLIIRNSNPLTNLEAPLDQSVKMDDVADKVRADLAAVDVGREPLISPSQPDASKTLREADAHPVVLGVPPIPEATKAALSDSHTNVDDDSDEKIDWSGSEDEEALASRSPKLHAQAGPPPVPSRSPSVEFEDVAIPDASSAAGDRTTGENLEQPDLMPFEVSTVQDSVPKIEEFDDFSDPEEEEMLRNLAQEVEEHARFANSLNNKPQAHNIEEYERELKQLRNQQKKDRRDADEVTHIMITECQQLLRLFGLPYVTAPMEAEAQCAELVHLGIVDGIVTDDSDCFLFGGTRIYKNMFNQAKFVECYLTSDLEKEFDLTRQKLISIAHLLGSDYTEGLPGVGPVTALEILSEFSTLDTFKDWWTGVQMNTIPKTSDATNPFRKKFRRNATKLFLPATFPDARVDIAYTNPDVDHNPEPFQWGVPDLDALRTYLMSTIGWTQERTDEILVPVVRDMNRRIDEGTQANITAFFDGTVGAGASGEAFAPRRKAERSSKRMGSALNRLAAKANTTENPAVQPPADTAAAVEPSDTTVPDKRKLRRKRAAATSRRALSASSASAQEDGQEASSSDRAPPAKRSRRPARRGGGRK